MLVQQYLDFFQDRGVVRVGFDCSLQRVQLDFKGAMLKPQQIS
jgi:hypothetical protein